MTSLLFPLEIWWTLCYALVPSSVFATVHSPRRPEKKTGQKKNTKAWWLLWYFQLRNNVFALYHKFLESFINKKAVITFIIHVSLLKSIWMDVVPSMCLMRLLFFVPTLSPSRTKINSCKIKLSIEIIDQTSETINFVTASCMYN